MQSRARRWLIRAAWCALLAATAAWLGLRVGRPLYYTDGARTVSALALAPAGMWLWSSPQPELALPGKVEGRVARLPDGRLLYARATERGDADLVLFDPAHPAAEPEPAVVLNSSWHDLAPGIAGDGTLWFASDRDGGIGGFDLYTSRIEGGAFTTPVPVAACNTMRDETDPAPDPRGGVVFAQVDRGRRSGNDGVLLRWDGGELQPQPLFGERGKARAIDRDPVFAQDGTALWFVRQDGAATHVVRSARLLDAFDPPLAVDHGWGTGALRSPLPVGRGELWLLRPAHGEFEDQWLRSDGREVLPWWTGQARIESMLLLCMLAAAVLLVLLYLGKRWRSLDLVTLCLLLSLLVHLLLMLWLMGVEIVGSMTAGDDGGQAVQVTLSDGRSGGGAGDASQLEDLAAAATFQPDQRALAADAPAAAAAAATRQIEAADGAWSGLATAATALEVDAAMHDERSTAPSHSGTDRSAAVEGAALAAVTPAVRAADAASHSAAAAESFTVAVPQAQLAGGTAVGAIAAPAAAPLPRPEAGPSRSTGEVAAAAELHDAAPAGAGAVAHAGTDVVAAQAHAEAPLAQPGSAAVAAGHSAASAAIAAELPGDALAANRAGVAAPAAAATGTPLPQPHALQGTGTVAGLHAPEHAEGPPRAAGRDDARANSGEGAGAALAAAALPAVVGDGAGATAASAPQHSAQQDAGAGTSAAVAAPGSELQAGAASAPLAGGSAALPLPAPRTRGAQSASMPLADARAAGPAAQPAPSATAAGTADSGGGGVKAATLPALAGGSATGAAAPGRATVPGAANAPALAAPGSELGAAAHGTAAPASAGVPLPVPAARAGRGPVAAMHEPSRADAGTGTKATASTTAREGHSSSDSSSLVAAALPALGGAPDAVRPQHAATAAPAPGAGNAAAAPPGSLLARATGTTALGSAPAALAAPGTAYSNRFGPAKQKALEQFGGTVDTERAVRNGLRYLASIQRPDGGWGDAQQFDEKYGFVRVGKTALCLLAFLGAGHTPSSSSEHSAVARHAVDFLLQLQQRETGAFGVSSAYGHGIATYALAECYGITKDQALRRPVEDALSWIVQHQGPRRDRRNQGGWGYFSPGLQAEDDYARVSISAWMVMALESARLSGIELPEDVLPNARRFLDLAWDQQNRFFRYNHQRSRLDSGWPTLPASTPAATFCLMLLGERADTERLQQALGYTVERRPQEYRRYADDEFVQMGQGNVYFWYYGTLACFLAGGDSWKQWNERLSSVLPAAQERDGSFAPIDPYARTAGDTATDRAFTTSMCVLSLEVYYRYFTPLLVGR